MRFASIAPLIGACIAAATCSAALAQPTTPDPLLAGAYTEEQALRGRDLYYAHCLACHGETLAGADKAPALTGPQFASTWVGAPLAALVARMASMPPEKPASLQRQEIVDLLTYVLWYNGLPLGTAPLAAEQDVLGRLTLQLPAGQ